MTATEVFNARLRSVPPGSLYLVAALPALWLIFVVATGQGGADSVKALELGFGRWALKLIIAVLAITPLRRFAGVNLIRWRRPLGVMASVYVLLHLASWLVLDMGLLWQQALGDLVKRPYITLGMIGAVLILPLALTSNDASLRRLGGARWRRLHRLTYPVALLAAIHFVLQGKVWMADAVIYLVIVGALLALRARIAAKRI